MAVAAVVEDDDFLLFFLLAFQGFIDDRPDGVGGFGSRDVTMTGASAYWVK